MRTSTAEALFTDNLIGKATRKRLKNLPPFLPLYNATRAFVQFQMTPVLDEINFL